MVFSWQWVALTHTFKILRGTSDTYTVILDCQYRIVQFLSREVLLHTLCQLFDWMANFEKLIPSLILSGLYSDEIWQRRSSLEIEHFWITVLRRKICSAADSDLTWIQKPPLFNWRHSLLSYIGSPWCPNVLCVWTLMTTDVCSNSKVSKCFGHARPIAWYVTSIMHSDSHTASQLLLGWHKLSAYICYTAVLVPIFSSFNSLRGILRMISRQT